MCSFTIVVQPVERIRKSYVKEALQRHPKCATIGTVQESFRASHGVNFNPCLAVFIPRQTNGQQAGSQQQIASERLLHSQREPLPSTARIESHGSTQVTPARIRSMAFAISPASALNPWLQILAALEKKVIRQSFETWLKPTRFSHASWPHTLCARSLPGVSAHRRQVWRPDPGSDRPAVAGVR